MAGSLEDRKELRPTELPRNSSTLIGVYREGNDHTTDIRMLVKTGPAGGQKKISIKIMGTTQQNPTEINIEEVEDFDMIQWDF